MNKINECCTEGLQRRDVISEAKGAGLIPSRHGRLREQKYTNIRTETQKVPPKIPLKPQTPRSFMRNLLGKLEKRASDYKLQFGKERQTMNI